MKMTRHPHDLPLYLKGLMTHPPPELEQESSTYSFAPPTPELYVFPQVRPDVPANYDLSLDSFRLLKLSPFSLLICSKERERFAIAPALLQVMEDLFYARHIQILLGF